MDNMLQYQMRTRAFIFITGAVMISSIIANNVFNTQEVLAIEQIATKNLTAQTPIDVITVIKQGEESVNKKLDQVRQALQSNDTEHAAQYLEEAKADLSTLAICATSYINSAAPK